MITPLTLVLCLPHIIEDAKDVNGEITRYIMVLNKLGKQEIILRALHIVLPFSSSSVEHTQI